MWILRHFYVSWGAKRADVRPEGRQLGFVRQEARVRWMGILGMLWSRVLPEVHLLHVGWNDLWLQASRELARDIKFDFLQLRSLFLGAVEVWSDMAARTSWCMAHSVAGINKARIKVNKLVVKFFVRNGGLAVRHLELEREVGLFL